MRIPQWESCAYLWKSCGGYYRVNQIKYCTRRELERFIGYLCHVATVVHPGRTFLCGLLHGAKQSHHFIRLSPGAHADILWWKCLLNHWSGHSFFLPRSVGCHVYSNASVFVAVAPWPRAWPSDWQAVDISVKELVPVVIAGGHSDQAYMFAFTLITWLWLKC